jgi:hypothetical protein
VFRIQDFSLAYGQNILGAIHCDDDDDDNTNIIIIIS